MKKHGATELVTWDQLKQVPIPEATRTHQPVEHHQLFHRLAETLEVLNYSTENAEHLISHDGQRYVGKLNIQNEKFSTDDYKYKIAVFNSHDKTLPVALIEGTDTFVCSNGLYTGEFIVSNKHTRNVWDTIYTELRNFAFGLEERKNEMFHSIEKLRDYDFSSNTEVHDFLIRAMKNNIINPTDIKPILKHWEEPEHQEFKDRNGYSLLNAHTSHWRNSNQFTLPRKTIKIKEFINEFKQPTLEPIEQGYREPRITPFDFGGGTF